jgi:hypothetical protein
MRRFIILRVVFVLVFVSGLVAAVLLYSEVIRRKRAEVRSTTAAEGQRIALHVQKGVLAATEPLKRLGQWWLTQGKPAVREDWATDGQLFLSQSPGLSEALWGLSVGIRETHLTINDFTLVGVLATLRS